MFSNRTGAAGTAFEVVGFEPTPLPDAADLAENIDLQVGRAPSPADSGLRPPIGVDPPLDAWTGGHLTARQAQWARDRLKSTAQNRAARQLPDLSIIIRVDPSSPGV